MASFRRRAQTEEEDSDVNLTPMLDVTFILLIFFIVTSTFVRIPGIEVERIGADNAVAIKSPIVVALSEKDQVWIDRREIHRREVYALVHEMVEDNPGARAMIMVDSESTSGPLLSLMQTMMQAGVVKVDVVTEDGS